MKTRTLFVALCCLLILISGCMRNNIRADAPPDPSDRSMSVALGGGGLNGALKAALREQGWQVTTSRGPTIYRRMDADTVQEFDSTTARYALSVSSSQFDSCFPRFDPAYNYDLAVVDTRTGEEVLTMSGRDCEHSIVDAFSEWLNKK